MAEPNQPEAAEATRAAILRERAQRLARSTQSDEKQIRHRVIVVRRGTHRIGLPLAAADEIRHAYLSELPHSAGAVLGLIQIRGRTHCVIDLTRFWRADSPPDHGEEIIAAIINFKGRTLAVLIDEVLGPRDIAADEVDEKPAEQALIRAVTKDYVNVLDVAELFDRPEIQMSHSSSHTSKAK